MPNNMATGSAAGHTVIPYHPFLFPYSLSLPCLALPVPSCLPLALRLPCAWLQVATEGLERLTALYQQGSRHVEALREATKKLRTLPLVDTELPTIALVGAPNVSRHGRG